MSSIKHINVFEADGSQRHDPCWISTEEALECPFCFSQIETQPLIGVLWNNQDLQLFLKCKKCKNSFIGYTKPDKNNYYHIISLSKGNHKKTIFAEEIRSISPLFVQIYGESEFAENNNLMQICGVGYRKALEFLIKDYLIKANPQKESEIKKKFLSDCIKEYITNSKIKQISERAAWLGNDETHYVKKWEDKDLKDLKNLISITVHFILMEIQANNYISEMNSYKKDK